MNILPRTFYLQDTVTVAKNLLGKKIVRKIENKRIFQEPEVARILYSIYSMHITSTHIEHLQYTYTLYTIQYTTLLSEP